MGSGSSGKGTNPRRGRPSAGPWWAATQGGPYVQSMETDLFCREIEAHLCRRNAGHLVRLVGPAFEMVVSWGRQGIPVKVACRGIDRFFERDLAKDRTRRRPVRIEFCEADVLDAFDEWRRAVGLGTAGGGSGTPPHSSLGHGADEDGTGEGAAAAQRPGRSLREHLDRVVTRLTDALASGRLPDGLERQVERVLDVLAGQREAARSLRGAARQEFVAQLQRLDDELMAHARQAAKDSALASLRTDAEAELSAFRGRMSDDDYRRAVEAATTALLRDRLKLPTVAYGQ